VGTNGIGKSTALKVLAGKLKPNLGRFVVCSSTRVCFIQKFFLIPAGAEVSVVGLCHNPFILMSRNQVVA
jgi:ABC-type cobalamin/Fe3+-siderophores transport system ATPase subunit